MQRDVLLTRPEATEQLGEAIGRRLVAGDTVALVGELGAGKTGLTRGLARGLGIDEPDEVCSPTYLIVMEHPGPLPLLHVDAYLPGKTRAFLEDGGIDYLAEAGGVVAVEWADRLTDLLPDTTVWIRLAPVEVNGREARRARVEGDRGRYGWIGELPERI